MDLAIRIYKYSYREFYKRLLKGTAILLVSIIIVVWWSNHSANKDIYPGFDELPWYYLFFFVILNYFLYLYSFLSDEFQPYILVRNMEIVYNKSNSSVVYICKDREVSFSFSDVDTFEIYRTVKDEKYIGYVIYLKNGMRLRFTNRLEGVMELQRDIESYGMKVENKTWFNNKKLPENIYV